jgi:hypothetical protein
MTKIVPNDLLKATEKTIKNWNCAFIAVEGPNILDKLSLEDLAIPYESQYRSRIVLKAGEVDQPLIYGFIGKAVTFLMIKVTYDGVNDPYYQYEQENYNITYYFENDPTLRPIGRLMIQTGSADDTIPQIYLNNPLGYDVVLDVLHATTSSDFGITVTGVSYNDLELDNDIISSPSGISYSGIKTNFVFGESIDFGDVLYVGSDSLLYKANALTGSTLPGMYLALESGVSGDTKEVMINGFVDCDKWNFNIGQLLYCSLISGSVTQNLDDLNIGDFVQVLGIAIKNKTVHFNPSLVIYQKQ